MILSVRINNYKTFSNEVELSLKANMHIKKFSDNIFKENKFNILKSACIYGPNNSGKTCIINAINCIQNVLLGLNNPLIVPNIFTDDKTCALGISFYKDGKAYSYDFKYDSTILPNGAKKGFVYECFKELFIDEYGNYSESKLFLRDSENGKYHFANDKKMAEILEILSNDNILIYTLSDTKYPIIYNYKKILRDFANSIDIIYMNNIPIDKTINVLKNNEPIKEKTIELIKKADLDIDDYKYVSNDSNSMSLDDIRKIVNDKNLQEKVLESYKSFDEMDKLVSTHKGKDVTSINFDSTGTKKIVAMASYIVDALVNNKILIVDELDSSLHFKLTKTIIALFNNDLNNCAQLLFTAHDATLLNCKRIFRKDQLWFVSKDSADSYLYSLADFTNQNSKIRSETDLIEKYNEGILGAIPEPDLFSILLSTGNEE